MLGLCGNKSKVEDTIFNGHAFQDFAANRKDKPEFDLVGIVAPLLDCMMLNHRFERELHEQRVKELKDASRITS